VRCAPPLSDNKGHAIVTVRRGCSVAIGIAGSGGSRRLLFGNAITRTRCSVATGFRIARGFQRCHPGVDADACSPTGHSSDRTKGVPSWVGAHRSAALSAKERGYEPGCV
jgi:hypothetical protein